MSAVVLNTTELITLNLHLVSQVYSFFHFIFEAFHFYTYVTVLMILVFHQPVPQSVHIPDSVRLLSTCNIVGFVVVVWLFFLCVFIHLFIVPNYLM